MSSDLIKQAFDFGFDAYTKRVRCVPAADSRLMAMLEGRKVGEDNTKILRGWIRGWQAAQLSDSYE